jgi:hypothetical protein
MRREFWLKQLAWKPMQCSMASGQISLTNSAAAFQAGHQVQLDLDYGPGLHSLQGHLSGESGFEHRLESHFQICTHYWSHRRGLENS